MARKMFESHRPEALQGRKIGLKPGDLIDILPAINCRLMADMELMYRWVDYFRANDVPFQVKKRDTRNLQLWKIRRA